MPHVSSSVHSTNPYFDLWYCDFLEVFNENILQIDDEYYAIARAKSKIISDQRTTWKLNQGGVDFIETDSISGDSVQDCTAFLNPFTVSYFFSCSYSLSVLLLAICLRLC